MEFSKYIVVYTKVAWEQYTENDDCCDSQYSVTRKTSLHEKIAVKNRKINFVESYFCLQNDNKTGKILPYQKFKRCENQTKECQV